MSLTWVVANAIHLLVQVALEVAHVNQKSRWGKIRAWVTRHVYPGFQMWEKIHATITFRASSIKVSAMIPAKVLELV